jgi:glycosyltransferase involved in cell wall biosynthesis
MVKVSVLVAAYNAEPWIGQCLRSLREQTLRDIEIVCVDDASTDSTWNLLKKAAQEDPRIIALHQKVNGGQAKARNRALQVAKGQYICMVDSDDWLDEDALQAAAEVLDRYEDTDSVLFQVDEVDGEHVRRYPMPDFEAMTGQEAFEASLTWQIHGLYMIREGIHRRFPYDDSSRAYSDDNTTRIHFLHSRMVRQCQGVYHYRQHAASVTHSVSVRRFDYLRANESMKRQMEEAGVCERLMRRYEQVRWLNLIDTYMFYHHHRNALDASARDYGLSEMRRVWRDIRTSWLPWSLRLKPGYMPLHPCWWAFRWQEEAYFSLRKWLKGS